MKPAARSAPPAARGWSDAWIAAALFLAVLAAYWPALSGGFLWDDDGHVTRRDLQSLAGLIRIWCEIGATQQYYPVLHSAFWLEHKVWGDTAAAYHLLNVLLHATAACQFGVLLRRLQVPGAWLAAALFALHPVAVESVAWISEQKNTLSAVFYLAAALAWLRFEDRRSPRDYAIASAWFVLALLTKTVTATLPAALLVLAWWRRGRLAWRGDVRPLLPWLAAGLAAGLFTAHFERVLIGAQGEAFALGLLDRAVLAGRVAWFYAGTLAWPFDLAFIYPRWTIDASAPLQWSGLAATAGLLLLLAAWSRRDRGPLAAALLFGGTLFPALGFFNVYPFVFSWVADHFQYLADLPLFALAAAGLARQAARFTPAVRVTAGVAAALALGGLTWRQSALYRDEFTLFEATLARNPGCWMAHLNLAVALTRDGRPAEAVPHLEAALRLRPDYPQAESNLGDNLTRLGRPREAIPHLERALRLRPDFADAHLNLGDALVADGRPVEAIPHFETALRLKPAFPLAHRNLGLALGMAGRTEEALPHFARAVALRPDYADAEVAWAVGLTLAGRFAEAEPHFERATEIEPANAVIRLSYGRALAGAGRPEAALIQLQAAVAAAPDNADTHLALADFLRSRGERDAATAEYQEAIRLKPALLQEPR